MPCGMLRGPTQKKGGVVSEKCTLILQSLFGVISIFGTQCLVGAMEIGSFSNWM